MKKIRNLHKVIGLFSFIPLMIICLSGIVLGFRTQVNWLSPHKPKIAKSELPRKWISSEEVLERYRQNKWGNSHTNAQIKTILYNLDEGLISIRTNDDFEYNLHGESGSLLNFGRKRSLFFNRIHQELFLGSIGKKFVALPSAFMLLFLLLSGAFLGINLKRKK
jgi:uncharacterized iron-regulated membrane protein